MKEYQKEMKLRIEKGGDKEFLRRYYSTVVQTADEVSKMVPLSDSAISEDRLIFVYLSILLTVKLNDDEIGVGGGCLSRAIGEVDGDWERISDAEEAWCGVEEEKKNSQSNVIGFGGRILHGEEKRNEEGDSRFHVHASGLEARRGANANTEMERLRQHPRLRLLTAIRSLSGALLTRSKTLKPSAKLGMHLLRSSSTTVKAAGLGLLLRIEGNWGEDPIKAALNAALYCGGIARVQSIIFLAKVRMAAGISGAPSISLALSLSLSPPSLKNKKLNYSLHFMLSSRRCAPITHPPPIFIHHRNQCPDIIF